MFLGMIHLALPNAKIIHTLRHPVDTCLSCFSNMFSGAQDFTYDLGRNYARYRRMMAHWHLALPPGTILDVRYEDVVANVEGQARCLLEHCGLPWDQRCLAFNETAQPIRTAGATQVPQPIDRHSVERWRVYEKDPAPLLDELGLTARRVECARSEAAGVPLLHVFDFDRRAADV